MTHQFLRATLIAALACLLCGCASDFGKVNDPSVQVVTAPNQAAATDDVSLDQSQVLQVRLPQQGPTGYSWRLASGAGANSVMQFQRQSTEQPEVGRYWNNRAHDVFTFRSTGTGQATLTFVLDRQWEPGAAPARTFTLTVNVK